MLDLGAVGKSHALDRMAETLADWDVTTATLNSGGSTLLALDGDWCAGVGEGATHRAVPLRRAALSASGTAVKGAHLVDPHTGRPAAQTTRAWALAGTAALSDALSTAFFVMSRDAVERFCAAHREIGSGLLSPGSILHLAGRLRAIAEASG